MRIIWEVEDGYMGKSRPQETEIDDEELEGLNKEEIKNYIHDRIQEDFEQTISWSETSREE